MTLIHGLHDSKKQSNDITYCISPRCSFNQSYFSMNPKNPNPLHFYKIYWLILHLTPTTQKWTTLLTNSLNLPSNFVSTITFPPKNAQNFRVGHFNTYSITTMFAPRAVFQRLETKLNHLS